MIKMMDYEMTEENETNKVRTKENRGTRLKKDENEDSVTTGPILSHLSRTLLFIY